MASDKTVWDAFSRYIRLRDTGPEGYGSCFTCGRYLYWRDGDAGHGISRRFLPTYLNEINVNLQCKGCNKFDHGAELAYSLAVDKKHGPGTWDKLKLLSKGRGKKLSTFEKEVLTKHFDKLFEDLKKSKHLARPEQY